ncbi:MAG: M14 family zinc carboxypeptidase [Chloroflexi bacterium]|nr:M14 family zinc carboxypeptidase [Chloroflexota bacterium]
MDLRSIAADIPDYQEFLTVDELNASSHRLRERYPQLVSIREVGATRGGHPIEMLTIAGGADNAFVFGGPHPNEPIGCMTIEYLSRRLCEDDALREELGYTWYFIKSIDADGMRLNEGWFKGPFTPTHYARHFYRPARREQVEWTFPIDYKALKFNDPLPETRALMRVIDETKPKLLYSLHNAGFGGVYYYVSAECPALYDTFHQIPDCFDLALDLGEPELSFAEPYAPAIYRMLTSNDMYDHLERHGIADPAAVIGFKASSAQYAERYNSFFLIVEMPYFDEPRVNDPKPTTTIRRAAILQAMDMAIEHDEWIRRIHSSVESALRLDSPFRRALEDFLAMSAGFREADREWVMSAEDTNRPATQAELFSNLYTSRFYKLLNTGLLARMLGEEIAGGNAQRTIQTARADAEARLAADGEALEAALDYRAIPIRSLVGVQCCAGLAAAAYLQSG